jgi:hypothetical protein
MYIVIRSRLNFCSGFGSHFVNLMAKIVSLRPIPAAIPQVDDTPLALFVRVRFARDVLKPQAASGCRTRSRGQPRRFAFKPLLTVIRIPSSASTAPSGLRRLFH